jgi:ABC-2 type transport system permease protein
MRNALIIARRELVAYFASPLAYVFIVIFLALAGALGFYVGGFFARGQADLTSFFLFHPWLFMILVPASSSPPGPSPRSRSPSPFRCG